MLTLSDEQARKAVTELRQLFGTVIMEAPEYVPSVEDGLAVLRKLAESAPTSHQELVEKARKFVHAMDRKPYSIGPSRAATWMLEYATGDTRMDIYELLVAFVESIDGALAESAPQEAGARIVPNQLYRSLMRLHVAVKACAAIGFEESSPTTSEHHASIWNDLNEAQADAALKLKHFRAASESGVPLEEKNEKSE